MKMRLVGRTALITGGTQGVGAAIAVAIAKAGGNLVLHGLRDDALSQATVATCRAAGATVHTVFCDLMSDTETAVNTLFSAALAVAPDLTLLVNNAGTFLDKPFLEMDHQTFERTWRLNVAAGYFLTQAWARHWIPRQLPGRVLFTGSINGQLAEMNHSAYDSSKGAVWMMVRSLCVSLAPHGIRVNSIAPGLVVTPLTAPVLEKDHEAKAWMQLHTPNGQVPGPECCGPAAVFLLSDDAEHIHGQTLLVDGGMSVWQQPELPPSWRRTQ
ncbi:MAG: SDR family oxidoreductase [Pirellulaceae bacterium]|nr:SDR family oxidoreductase [Pirellulaceae bacterium]